MTVPAGSPTPRDEAAILGEALDMLDSLAEYAHIGLEPPPDHVFRFFQRLHGVPEVGAPPAEPSPRECVAALLSEREAARDLADAARSMLTAIANHADPFHFHARGKPVRKLIPSLNLRAAMGLAELALARFDASRLGEHQ